MNNRPLEILLVEDNQADVDLIRDAMSLRKMSMHLHVFATGEEALQYLLRLDSFTKALRPDLILLDLNLPGMDGREVLERIKTDRGLRQIPVIVLTSAHNDLDVLRSYSMGASCYILKPVDPKLFSQVINQTQDFWFNNVQLPNRELVEKYNALPNLPTSSHLQKSSTEGPVHVLYIEDSDADSEHVFEDLDRLSKPQFILRREARLADAFKYLETHSVDVVLLDLFLPDSEGFETVLRFHANSPLLPLVVFTAREDQAQGIRAVQEGADDYLVKGQTQSELLGRTLLHAIERKSRALSQLDLLARERTARNEAEKAATIRDEFLSVAGHELRNPLTSLKLHMQLLLKTLQNSEKNLSANQLVKSLADKADEQIDRFGKLIDTLLNFSQIQSGRLKLEYSKFELNQIIQDTVERFTHELKSANCEIILDLGPPVEGEWDLLRIEQVLINLLSNGIKYAPGKPITVAVTSDSDEVWIRVIDQGPGIAPQDREIIFQRFERVKGNKGIPGLGIGLYVVRQIIDTHGGTIQLKSELGVGSTFTICLPRKNRRF